MYAISNWCFCPDQLSVFDIQYIKYLSSFIGFWNSSTTCRMRYQHSNSGTNQFRSQRPKPICGKGVNFIFLHVTLRILSFEKFKKSHLKIISWRLLFIFAGEKIRTIRGTSRRRILPAFSQAGGGTVRLSLINVFRNYEICVTLPPRFS